MVSGRPLGYVLFYSKWKGVLARCYSDKYLDRQPTYQGCSVYEEWLTFSNFRKWMEVQNWENRDLDKDFLIEGNKIYSPSTCVFIPDKVNSFILTGKAKRGQYPLGVNYQKKPKCMINERTKPYVSQISSQKGKILHLGCYATPMEAHQRYLREKLKQCVGYIQEFKDEPLTAKGLIRVRDKICYHIDNNLELTSF